MEITFRTENEISTKYVMTERYPQLVRKKFSQKFGTPNFWELCGDNLQPDFLYDHIQPVRAELFQVGH